MQEGGEYCLCQVFISSQIIVLNASAVTKSKITSENNDIKKARIKETNSPNACVEYILRGVGVKPFFPLKLFVVM